MADPRTPSGSYTLTEEISVPAREARFATVAKGQVLQLVDVEGRQVGDFVAFMTDSPAEYLSPAHTCSCLVKLTPEVGDSLFSNHRRPLFKVVSDDVGHHDFVVPCCDPERYEVDYGITDHPSCLSSLQAGLDAFGSDWPLHGEFAANIFMNNVLTDDHRIETLTPDHDAGAALDLEVLEDLTVGLVACPQDLTPCNDFNPTDMAMRIWSPE